MNPRAAPVAWKLFFTCWLIYSLHFATNIVREHYPAFALAERGTLRVDPYLGLHDDLFELEGRGAFINNNPGASLLAALPYAALRPLVDRVVARIERARAGSDPSAARYDNPRHPNSVRFFREARARGLDVRFGLAAGVIQLLCTAPLSALAAVVMRIVLLRAGFGAGASLWLALLYAFGTPLFFRSGHLNHNLLVAHFAFFSFALLYRPGGCNATPARLTGAGVLAGLCVLCDYSGVLPLAALGLWVAASLVRGRGAAGAARGAAWMAAGAAVPLAALLGYQAWAFGNPLLPAQHYMPEAEYSGRGWNGMDWPAPDLLVANLFDLRFGLFAFGPLLALGLAAPALARRARCAFTGAELALFIGLAAGMLVFTSANQYARLQWNTGFRMLAPAVPFLFLATAAVLVRLPRRLAIALAVAAGVHSWVLAMVREDVVTSWSRVVTGGPTLPWLNVLWMMGDQYLPLLQRTGPQGWPIVLAAALGLAALWWPRGGRSAAADAPRGG